MKQLLVLGMLSLAAQSHAQSSAPFEEARSRVDVLRLEIRQNQIARLAFRRTQTRPTRRLRAGAPLLALGVAAASSVLTILLLREDPQPILPELSTVAAAGVTLAVIGLALLIRGRRMRRRSEDGFWARHDALETELRQLEIQWGGR